AAVRSMLIAGKRSGSRGLRTFLIRRLPSPKPPSKATPDSPSAVRPVAAMLSLRDRLCQCSSDGPESGCHSRNDRSALPEFQICARPVDQAKIGSQEQVPPIQARSLTGQSFIGTSVDYPVNGAEGSQG